MFKSKSDRTSSRKISSQKSELKRAKQQWEKQFSCIWKCLILLFLAAFEKILSSVIFCLLPSCTNHAGISLSVWMHFFSKLSDKCGCKMMAQERGYAWKCHSHMRRQLHLAFPSLEFLFMEISKSQMLSKHLFQGHWGSILSSWVSPSWSVCYPCGDPNDPPGSGGISSGAQRALKRHLKPS